jgi:uncharacterized protein (UPF0332 family)
MKDKRERLSRIINSFLKKQQLFKSEENKRLEKPFILKARKNFSIANLLYKISEQDDLKKMLALASDFEMHDWVIIVSYYSMYTSALSALAKLGFKSKSHQATIAVLEYNYVKETGKNLEHKDLQKLTNAQVISELLITKLMTTKTNRETAQYDATPAITREMAKTAIKDAESFISKIEEVLA